MLQLTLNPPNRVEARFYRDENCATPKLEQCGLSLTKYSFKMQFQLQSKSCIVLEPIYIYLKVSKREKGGGGGAASKLKAAQNAFRKQGQTQLE